MSTNLSRDRFGPLDRLFFLSVVLGPAASYSIIYLFHLVLVAKLSRSALLLAAKGAVSIPRGVHWDILFFCIFLGWYMLSILWAQNTTYALRYCAYVGMAALTVFYTVGICSTLPRLQAAFRILAVLFSFEIGLAVLEGAGLIRLPFSPYSSYQVYFGRTPSDLGQFSEQAVDYILGLPTGFFGNPNNLASFLTLILPFFLLHRKWSVRLVGAVSILFVVYMAGARVALITYALVVMFSILLYANGLIRVAVIGGGLVATGLGAGLADILKESSIPRVAEVGAIGVAVRNMVTGLISGDVASQESVGMRVQLILNGLEALRDSFGLGVGAGGSVTVQELSSNQPGRLTSMHNFWVELLVEGGIAFALIFAGWYISLLWRLWLVGKYSNTPMLRYCGRALLVGFLGFVFGAVGPSSVIYMLPMWMLVGVALATIHLESVRKARRLAKVATPNVRSFMPLQPGPMSDPGVSA